MHIKIQGGGSGVYSNNGTSFGTANYLNHEDKLMVERGESKERFFTHNNKEVSTKEVVKNIDNNKAQLKKKDAKYFVITISPSKKELEKMGKTRTEQSKAMKEYINEKFIPEYAKNFNKGLGGNDIMFYGKIHLERGKNKTEGNLHAHIIVSRKTIDNKMQISPNTNHRGTTKGVIKGGFNRDEFFQKCEKSFDEKFNYSRHKTESYKYCNTLKNGKDHSRNTIKERENQIKPNQTIQKEKTELNFGELPKEEQSKVEQRNMETNREMDRGTYLSRDNEKNNISRGRGR